ncbi:MAG: RluA family pseudouridine synthase [Bacteriovoracaceae bacterium]|nr:RluA family pseudouridine synthase [Bacteriovoracaceae bacterium]
MTIIHKIYRDDVFEVRHMADEEHDGMRLDQFLGLYLESFSREIIKKKIKANEIEIVGRPGVHKPSSVIHHKDEVIIRFYKSQYEDEYWRGQKLELQTTPEVVYEDTDLLVISKPAFMSTHPAGRHLFNCATVFFELKYNHTIHSLHRIDRETSGILMLGKNPKMATEMMERFEDDDVKKCYLFISKIVPNFSEVDEFIARERMGNPEEGLKRIVVKCYPENSPEGKHATTYFYLLEKNDKYVIGLACPQTGRQHQIRVHAKAHGLPLVGDKLYLGDYEMFQRFKDNEAFESDFNLMELPRHALHAIALKIPYKKEEKLFLTSIPKDLAEWITHKTEFSISKLEEKIQISVKKYYNNFK